MVNRARRAVGLQRSPLGACSFASARRERFAGFATGCKDIQAAHGFSATAQTPLVF